MGRLEVLVILCAAALWVAPLPAQSEDSAAVAAAVREAEVLGVRVGVAALDVSAQGQRQATLAYARRAGEGFIPASNMKIVTAVAALAGLGPDHQFETRVHIDEGELVVLAGGDPNWREDGPMTPGAVCAQIVDALKAAGVRELRRVNCDVTQYPGPMRPSGWPKDQLDRAYCAPTAGLVMEAGCLLLRVRPGQRQARVQLVSPPAPHQFDGGFTMTDNRKKGGIYGALDTAKGIRLRGHLLRGVSPRELRTSMMDPVGWVEATIRGSLRDAGIGVDAAASPNSVADLTTIRTGIAPAVHRCLLDSSNFDAEMLMRELGAARRRAGDATVDGSIEGGLKAARTALRAAPGVGHGPAAVVLADGSGLSRSNRLTPAYLVTVLSAGWNMPEFVQAMPVAGQSGTLSSRFGDHPKLVGRVLAKTGWIRGASSLSGGIRRSDGGVRVFSILMNYEGVGGVPNRKLKAIQERIVAALDASEFE